MRFFAMLLALVCAAPSFADNGLARRFFGHVQTPCHASKDCEDFKQKLLALTESCTAIDEKCPAGRDLLVALFGSNHSRGLPNFIVYLDQSAGAGTLKSHPPRLMWNDKNTPHLYGVRDLFTLVVSEHKACIDAVATTELKTEPNPFKIIFDALGAKVESVPGPKPPAQTRTRVSWFPLSGDPNEPKMWLGFVRTGFEPNSVNRITLAIRQPKPPAKKPLAKPKEDAKDKEKEKAKAPAEEPEEPDPDDECVTKRGADGRPEFYYVADSSAPNGFFSNSSASRAGFSVALGATLNTRNTSIASDGSNQELNGYALVKYYLVRPTLRADLEQGTYYPSWALVVGTGLKDVFDEFVVGVSAGHRWGGVGLVLGANSVPGPDKDSSRKWRPFVGIDYSF